MSFFEPDRYFSRISTIDISWDVLSKGFRHVLLDVDNTILTRDTHQVPRDALLWLASAKRSGIKICLLSNNFHQGVITLANSLDVPIVAKAVKPLPFAFMKALRKIDGSVANTLMIGDQLITDVFGAHLIGMTAYLVCPLVEADLKHTLLLRNIERLFLGARTPEDEPAFQLPASAFEGQEIKTLMTLDEIGTRAAEKSMLL